MAASIDFCTAKYSDDPLDHMLHDALVHLVKDVGGDGAIDVKKWEF